MELPLSAFDQLVFGNLHLPQELWSMVFEFLSFGDWMNASAVCKDWRGLSSLFLPYLYYDSLQLATSRQPFVTHLQDKRKQKLRLVATHARQSVLQSRTYTVPPNGQFWVGQDKAFCIFPLVFTLSSEGVFNNVSVIMCGWEILRWNGDPTHRKTFDLRSTGSVDLFRLYRLNWCSVYITVNLIHSSVLSFRCNLPTQLDREIPFCAHITRITSPITKARPTICVIFDPTTTRCALFDAQKRKPDRTLSRFPKDDNFDKVNVLLPPDLEFGENAWYAFLPYKTNPPKDWLAIAESVIRMQRRPVILRNSAMPDIYHMAGGYVVHSSLLLEFVDDPNWQTRPTITYDVPSVDE